MRTLVLAAAVVVPFAAAAQTGTPDLTPRPLVAVGGFENLATLTAEDPDIAATTATLARRHRNGWNVLAVGCLAGLGLFVLGSDEDLGADVRGTRSAAPELMAAGSVLAAVASLVGLGIMPARAEYYAAINAWNARHPDRPLSP